jgi:signal peptidase II
VSPGADETLRATPGDSGPSGPLAAIAGSRPRVGLLWWLSAAVVALDQATKALIDAFLPVYESWTLIPGLVDIVHVHNAGVAFGMLNGIDDPRRGILTTGLALAALAGIAYYARHIRPEERLARLGLSLILGGAVGNLIDRLRQGYVVDFVDVYWGTWHFWAFNVADAAISIGATLVFVEVIFLSRHASHPVSDR